MQISTLLLAGAAAAAAPPTPDDTPKKPGWAYEVYYWNLTNWRYAELTGAITRYHYVFDISAPVFDPASTNTAPLIPSFTGTCEGETTPESPDQSSFADCTASRKKGESSDGGTFLGLSARVQPNDIGKPNVTISFQWNPQTSTKKYHITAGIMNHWAVGQPDPMKFDILDPDMHWEIRD